MGRARRIVLDTRTFEKSGDASAFFSAMLNRYRIGDTVSVDDALDLAALFKRHDDHTEKTGAGISEFVIRHAPDGHPGQCFWILRADGSEIDMSFVHCLAKKPYD